MIGLSKKGDLKRILWILIVGMLLFGAFAGFLVFGETAEEEKLRLEAELAQLESDLSAIEGGRWVNYSCNVNQIFFNNYNCDNQIGYHTVKVLTEGIHNQRFNFSNQIADAHNLASVANVTTNGSVNQFIDDTDTDFLKGNLSLNVSIAGTGAGANVTLKPFGEITANASTVLLMHFNNDTGTGESASLFLDNSTYGNNGTCSLASNQCPIFNESNAKYGRAALEFDGLDDYFNISNSTKGKLSMGNSSFTVEAWVKPKNNIPNAINPMYITSQYCTGGNCPTAGFTWSVTQSGTVRIVFGRGSSYSLYTNKTISAGEWSHIAVNIVKVAAQSKAYINGISVNYTEQKPEDITNDISLIGTTNNNTAVGQINLEVDGGGSFFNGTMDELAIWNGSLSSDIIAMHAGYVIIGNFTSQVFDANKSVQWSYISWYQGADEKGVSNLYQQDLSNVINASTVLYMKFNNDTLESERQLNVTHNISAETNLVLYMPFDSANAKELKENGSTVLLMHFNNRSDWGENDTFFVDNSTLFNNGTCNLASSLCPSVNTTDFKFGRASLTFDGTNDFVNVSSLDNSTDLPSTLTTYSFETWFKGFGTSSGTTPATIGIRDSTGGNGIFLVVEHRTGASPGISVNIRDNANTLLNPITDVGDKLTDRNWHHEAVVRDGNTVRTYLDGALISTASATLGNIGWNQALIGSNNVGSIFNGSLDEVAIWNVSLSSQIIAQHSGYGIDRSIYGNNASLMNGSVINFTGKFQEAMQFDAFNDYVEIKDSDDWGFGTDDFAIEMWVNSKVPVVSANIYNLISQSESAASNYWSFRKNDDANLKWRFEANPGPSLNGGAETTMLEIGRWYHMAVTRVGGTLTIYQNGIAIASGSGATSMPNLNAPLHIGFRRNVVGDFNGTMDEVVIWKNKTLSADKIAEHAGAKIIDYSQYGNNGTRNFNSTSDFGRNFTDGKFSKALQFDGVNDFVNVTNITGLNLNGNAATLEAWVNPRAITGPPHTIIRKDLTGSDGGYFFDFSNEDNIRFSLGGLNGGNPLASTQSPTVDEWNHIAGTYDGSAMRIFLNGVQIASVATSGSITTGPDTTIIGNDEGLTTPVNGTIDELSIWNVSLSADEIRKHYEKGVLKLNLSYRTSQDNVTFTAWTSVGNNTLSAITSNAINRYFQYKADFNTTDARYTPILNNVSINYTIRSNLTIFDDTELRVVIANERFNFTANFTDFVKPINGTNINCTISLNSTGSYAAPIKMNFTSQNKYYYYETSFSNKTIASFNVTCDGTALGHRLMRTIDAFNVTVARVSNFNGTTTDYNNLAAFDNISNAILEIVGFGRITWLNTINITGADLNKNINISQNNIGLFPENLHRTLNTSANITIYNVQSLVSPRILRNNVTCPESICTLISYNGTAITFNVTSFSNHSVTNGTLNITVNLNNTLVSAGTPILVSGKANLSNGTNVSNNLIRLFVDGTEQGIGLNFIDNSDADFNKSTNLNATRVRGTGSNANVTLADWDYDPDGNLSVNLTAYWKFDEPTSSNNRSDYKGNNNLATNSTITRVDGVREGAANFTRTRQQYLNISNNTDLSVGGNISFTIAAWVFLDSEDVMYAVSKHNNVAGDMEWFLRFDGGTDTDKFRFQVVEGATTNKDVTSTTTVTNGTWYFLVAWYDDDANTINLQVDNSVVDTTTGIGALNFTGSPFRIGAFSRTPSNFWDGRIDEVAFWKRILTQKERNVLYNGTNASSYPYLSGNTFKPYKGNFTSQIFDAGRTVNFSYISWYQGADDKGVSAGYQQDLGGLVNASTVLYMKFNNDTLESERQLNVTHNISAETNLVLYMPFDSASARELTANASTVLLMHFNNVSPENYNMSNTTLIYDNSSYGNNGTLFLNTSAGNFTPNGGRFGGAFVFDGRDDFINITSLRGFSNGTNASTIEAWFKADGFPDGRTTIAGYGQDSTNSQRSFYLGIGTSGTDRVLKIRTNGDDTGGNTIVSTNTWYHAAVVDDGTNMKLYLNGILDASVARVGSGKLAEEAFIGRIDPGMGEAFFNGTIDEVAIWNVSLSSAIIAQHSGYGIDRSIYGNNATLMFNTTVNQSGKFGEAMQFGGNGFVNVTQSSNWNFSTRDYAIEFWVKFRGFVNNVIMVDLGGDTNIETRVQYDNVNKKFVVYRGGDLVVNTDWTASTDTWYHVAASVSSNNVRGYIDGSQIGTGSNTRPVNNTQNLIIGAFRNANGNFVNGTMDEVAIWNKTLSSDLIAQHAGAKIVDYSNYGNNGTRNFNSTSDFGRNFTDGKFSKALLFDGKNDWINVTNASGLNIIGNSITMEAWVYPITMTTNKAGVFRKNRGGPDGGFIFDIDTDDGLRMVLNVSGTQTLLTTAGIPQNNVWSHVAGTYDGTTMRLYLNGVQVASQASSGSIGVSDENLIIGNDPTLVSPFNGTIDEVAIWNVSLSSDEIRKHYEKGVLKLNLSYRTSNDSTAFSQWTPVPNNTLSTVGFSIADDSLIDVVEGVVVRNEKIKESGFLNMAEECRSTDERGTNNYLNVSILNSDKCKAAEAQHGRAPSSQLGVLSKYMRVQNSQRRVESPVRGALKTNSDNSENVVVKNVNESAFFTFSSSRNLSFLEGNCDFDIISSSSEISSIVQGCLDMLLCERCYEACNYLFNRHACFQHLQNLPDHDSGAFESGLAMADFAVRNDVFVDFDSHDVDEGKGLFKGIENQRFSGLPKMQSIFDSIGNQEIIPIDEFKKICPTLDCNVVDYITAKKKIKDIKEGDIVLSLDENSGKLKPAKVNALLDHGIKPIFELKTISGRAINTTAEHPYLVKLYDKALCDKYANTFWNRNTLTDIKSTITTSESIKNNEFDEKDYCTRWVEVSELKKEMEIAVPYYKTGAVKWEKIAFITTLDEQHVYDLAIEGTQNFIANDIIAHNTARYFRYLAKFNTSNSNLSPILNDVTINYTGIFTDNFGNYNYTFNAPTTATTYTVKVNATSNNIPGEALTTFRVTAIPVINTNFTIPTFPMFNRDVTIVANVTDADNTIVYVNFTLYAPNGSIINLTNSSRVGDLHNASFNLTSYGTWRWNITVFDSDGFLVNSSSTGEIILMQITENFNVTATEANASISVSGHVNLSNGTNVSDSLISIFFNEVLMGINNLTPVGNYKQKQFVDDSDSDFLKGNLSINSRVVGTGAGANVTINISSLQNQTQNIQQRGITVNASTILYLRFEEGTGQYANDSSQYGNNGTFGATTASASDDPVWNSSAKFGSFGVSFNTNDFVNISDSNSLDVVGNLSIEAWIKPNSLSASGRAMLVDKADYPTANDVGYTIFLDPSGSNLIINGFIANSGGSCQITGTQAFTSNEWHHVAFTYDGVRGRTYVDGLTDTDSACTQSPAANAVHLTVGMTSDARNFYNGTIDEVGIWNISLDNATILQHYQLGWGYFNTSNFTSQVFDANAVVNWSYISWYQGADDKGISNLYQQDLSNVINASTVLYMKFNNDTLESERQLNATHNISAETNLVLYMPFDSANARELKENGSTVLLMHFNNDTGTGENASLFLSNATFSNVTNGTCNLASGFCPVFNKSNARLGAAALEFDGVDDVVNTTFKPKNMLGTNKSFSISLWTFLKSAKNQNFIHTPVGDGGDRFYFIVDTGTYIIGLGSQFKDTGIVPVTGFWQHLVVTWNGSSSLKLYVDGALRKEESYTGDGQPANGNMVIGASASDGSLVINGTIDEVAIWNISLSSGDIAKHSGYGIDRSIYGNNATLMNGTIVNQSGKFFEAMQFDGKGDFVNLSNDSDFNFGTGEFAVEFWMKTTDTSDNSLIDKSISESPFSGWYFYFRGAGDIDFFANNDANTLDGKIKTNDGNWHHITATRRGTTSYLYVDAVLDVSAAHSSNDNTAAALLIGTQRSSALFFNGTMDEVAIWNKSLSSDLIAQHAGAKIIDYSQYGNNGTRNFNSSSDFGRNFTDGKFSKALLFDAINDYVNVSDSSSLDINNSLTIEAWVKFDGLPNDNMNIVSKGDTSIANYNYNIRTNLAQLDYAWKCCGTTDNVYRTTSSVLTTGVWTHIAATHVSGNTPKIYINGIEQSASITSGAATTPLNYSADHLYIGSRGRNEASGAFVNGTIDEVAIWNISLSESEIRKHYEKGVLKLNLSYRTSNDSTTFSQWYGAGNNTLSTVGLCVAEDSLITLANGSKKKIKEIQEGEYVQSLDEKTGKIVTNKVNALLDMGNKTVYQLTTESGRAINTTKEHPYLIRIYKNSNSSGRSLITLPSISSGECCFSNLEIERFCASKSFARILNSQIPKCLEEANCSSVKCLSRVISNLCSDKVSSNTSPFSIPLGDNLTSCPNLDKKENKPLCTFSSNKNFILGRDKFETSFCELSSKLQSCFDVLFNQGRVCFKDFFCSSSIFEHFQNYRNHDSCTFESRLSMANIGINNDIIINFDSHEINNDSSVFKYYENNSASLLELKDELIEINNVTAKWVRVNQLKKGMEIAVPDYESNTIKWEKIVSINVLEPQHVYDLSIEGTKNFIANDIIAHNTGRYFQYKADFNTTDARYSPILNNVTINYSGIFTDAFGNYNYTFRAPSSGSYSIKVNATYANISGEAFTTLQIDTSAPRINFTRPTPANNSRAVGNAQKINISITDNAVSRCTLQVHNGTDNATNFTMEIRGLNCNVTITTLDGYNYTLKAYATDTAGNENSTENHTFRENTKPEIPTLNAPANNSRLLTTSVILNYTTNDNDTDNVNYIVYFDTSTNPTTIVYRSTSKTFVVSTTRGTTYFWKVQADDTFENSSNSTIRQFTINSLPPTPLIITPNLTGIQLRGSQTYNVSWVNSTSDAEGDQVNISLYYSTDSGLTYPNFITSNLTNNGTYGWLVPSIDSNKARIKAIATDSYETSEDTSDNDFTIDSTAPTITLDNPPNGSSFNNGTFINLTITDNLVGGINVSWNNNSYVGAPNRTDFNGTYDINTTDWQVGEVNISVYANDSVGNLATAYFRFSITDVQPVVTFNAPSPNQVIRATFRVNVSSTSQLDDAAFVNFTYEGATQNFTMTQAGNDYFYDFDTTTVADRQRRLSVYGNNSAGTVVRADIFATIDNTAPAIRLDSPANDTWKNSSVTFVYVPNDVTTSIVNCSLIINGTINRTNSSISEGIENLFSNVVFGDGIYRWDVNCTDTIGNNGSNGTARLLKIDTIIPTITLLDPPNDTSIRGNKTINFSVTDSGGAGIANLTWSSNYLLDQTSFIGTYGINTSEFPEGKTNITIVANDSAGNKVTLVLTYIIDITPPLVTFNKPSPRQVVRGIFRVNITATDALSNVSSLLFAFNGSSNFTMNRTSPEVTSDYFFDWNTTNASDKEYVLKIFGNDTAGNIKFEPRLAIVDNTAPAIRLDSPSNNTFSKTRLNTFTFTVSELNNLNNCTLLINGSINSTITSPIKGENSFSVNLNDALYRWTVNCSDEAVDVNGTKNVGTNSTELLISIDTVNPQINMSVNDTSIVQGDVVNVTANVSDNIGLSFCQFVINETGSKQFFNKSVTGTGDQCSQNFTLRIAGTANFTVIVNDTANNLNQSERIVNVSDITPPQINMSLNDTIIELNEIVNVTANISDNIGLSFCQFIINQTGSKEYLNKSISGANDQCSQIFNITLDAGNVINFTVIVNDTANNKNQSEIIATINDTTSPILESISLSSTSITSGSTLKLRIKCIDNSSNLAQINFTLQSPTGKLLNRSSPDYFTIPSVKSYILNYTIFEKNESSEIGTWNVTAVGCKDNYTNSIYNTTTALTFTVTSAPSPAPSAGAAGAGAGGGGGAPFPVFEEEKVKEFSLSTISIKEQLALGIAKTRTITIKNTGKDSLSFNLNVVTVNDFVFLSDTSFSLNAGEEKTIEANIIGKKLGSYFGDIEITADGIKKTITVIVEVESEQVLFDAKIDIPSAYKEVQAGDDLKAQITLLNVGPPRKVDVTTTYIIKDKLGNIVYEGSETFAVEKQTSFVKSFKIPTNLQPGDYLAIIEVRYADSFAVSSELFRVVPEEETIVEKAVKSNKVIMSVLIIFVGLTFLFVYLLVPKVMIPKVVKLENTLNKIKGAIARNDIESAKKMYIKARKIYMTMKIKDKKSYKELIKLYNKLR